MTNEELVYKIQLKENTSENMMQLYEQVKDFIRAVAWKYRNSEELEDLEQEGFLALYPAIENYNPSAGCKFLTYAETWIRQRMQRYIQNQGSCLRLPVHCLEKVQKYRRFCSEYEQETGKYPSDCTAAYFLDFTVEQVKTIRVYACMASVGCLDAPVTGLEGTEDSHVIDLVSSAENLEEETVERLANDQLKKTLWGCVDELPEEQRDVIKRCYQNGNALSRIGLSTGRTPAEVRKLHGKALKTLRRYPYGEKLRPFLPEDERIYSSALWGNGAEHFIRTWTSSTERVALKL